MSKHTSIPIPLTSEQESRFNEAIEHLCITNEVKEALMKLCSGREIDANYAKGTLPAYVRFQRESYFP
jgi:hypothetical protein